MSLQKVCFCMMKHDLLQRNRYAFRKRPDKGKETKKVFHKNSSLITTAHNALKYSALLCDELYFQLITLKVNQYRESTINTPKISLCDELNKQLVTLQHSDNQDIML